MPTLPRVYSTMARPLTVRGTRRDGRMSIRLGSDLPGREPLRLCPARAGEIQRHAAAVMLAAGLEDFGATSFGALNRAIESPPKHPAKVAVGPRSGGSSGQGG